MKDRNVILGFLIGGGFEVIHFESSSAFRVCFRKAGKNYMVESDEVNFYSFIIEFDKVYKIPSETLSEY